MERSVIVQAAKDYADSYEDAKDKLFIKVRNSKDKTINAGAVHTDFEDLSLLYYVHINDEASLLVTEGVLNHWGIRQEQLHEDAIKSSRELDPEGIFDLGDLLGNPSAILMIVVTTQSGQNGAAALFYPGVVERLAKMLNGSFIILPSSVHEVIAIPDDEDLDNLERIVREINGSQVAEEDRLSDHVYRYNCNDGKVRLVA